MTHHVRLALESKAITDVLISARFSDTGGVVLASISIVQP